MEVKNEALNFLVVEDNPGDFTLLDTYLRQTKLFIGNVSHAMRLDETSRIPLNSLHLAFLDLSLPDSAGIKSFIVLNKLLPNIPIVVLSGMGDEKTAIECISLGAQDYLRKDDLNHVVLEKSIQYSIERHKNAVELRRMQDQAFNHMKQITEATIAGQEKERDEIGKELHDNINQILASATLFMDMAMNDHHPDAIYKSKEYVSKAIEEIRCLSRSLVPPEFTKEGLIDKINEIVSLLNAAGMKSHILLHDFDECNLDNGRKLALYRVVQEQSNNILKYANADQVRIELKQSKGNIFLNIEDNGSGFNTNEASKGIGLRNIESRISFYSGRVSIQSTAGKGTILKILLPLNF
ncbi:MAG TPA: response regulator [Flavitalea sp.]|nr:response regulator [Flavitalea sp.]